MVKTIKSLSIALVMLALVVSFSIPFMLFPSKVYADSVPYVIGDTGPAGGIIFYVDGSSCLEAAPSDQSTDTAWSDITNALAGASGTAIGTGQANTTAIINQTDHIDVPNSAAKICDDLVLNGYDNWFLPSQDELNLMYTNLKVAGLGGLAGSYWSSSEAGAEFAWVQDFRDGSQGYTGKFSTLGRSVRAIRAFTGMKETGSAASAASRSLTPEEIVVLNLNIWQQVDTYGANYNGFVKMLYDNVLGRVPDDAGYNNWTGQLSANTMTGSQVAFHFIFSEELAPTINSLSNNDFIAFIYQALLNRPYDALGYDNWKQQMEPGMTREELVNNFLSSEEFTQICNLFNVVP